MARVSAATFDAQGAQNAEMRGVWIDRTGDPMHPYGPRPEPVVESLGPLTEELGAR